MNYFLRFSVLIMALFISSSGICQYVESEWEDRDTWMDVNFIFDQVGIEKGSYVADIGCHEGYLSVHLARRVGDSGKIYAVDVREDRLETLRENLQDRKLRNVEVILGDYDDPKLPRNALDVVIIMDTYHEMDDYRTILDHVYSSLKPNGKIVIVEKLKTRIIGKSRDAQTNAHSLGTEYVTEELRDAGFRVIYENNDLGDWENDTDKVIWMLIGRKT
ncbi:class I SAM-dependent methyltransferase [Aureisphaera galaxeae]|uniref:class I SAM-dependent methyltransferase n=1 Tax=Aureisphaera galaxeae TaxID=1538023 RepID=UPI00234FF486|nr:class I SAM-dependent methyltransferase [Aureisphaera galaxeae]MDC8004244.1 class I SAM-dependent methyltransferase [Aureisphaera galaxeae]